MNEPALKKRSKRLDQWLGVSLYLALIAFFVSISHGQSITRVTPEKTDVLELISERGELRVAMAGRTSVPFFRSDRELTSENMCEFSVGIDHALACSLAVAVGENIDLVLVRTKTSTEDVINLVENGQADIAISKISRTVDRAKRVSFSRPYATFRQAMLADSVELTKIVQDQDTAESLRTFDGLVVVPRATSFVEFAGTFLPKSKLMQLSTTEQQLAVFGAINPIELPVSDREAWNQEMIDARQSGQPILGIYSDEINIRAWLKAYPQLALTMTPIAFDDLPDSIAVVVPQGQPALLEFVNLFLEQRFPHFDSRAISQLIEKSEPNG